MTSKDIELWLSKNIGFENPKLGLSRIERAIEKFPIDNKVKVVTVAGTNGKGGTSRLIYSGILKTNSAALFTSPHFESITERFSANGELIRESQLLELCERWFIRLKESQIDLSYFEFLFFIFYQWSSSLKVNYLVLEVGLGGKYDATNAIDADVALVTSIARDHQDYLGNTYKEILGEKIAISRKNKPLITAFSLDYLHQLVDEFQKDYQFQIKKINTDNLNFQQLNLALAVEALSCLNIRTNPEQKTRDYKIENTVFCPYGSHNLDAVRKLVHYLSQYYYTNSQEYFDLVVLSFSKRDKRELDAMLTLYKTLGVKVVLLSFDHFKAIEKNQMKQLAKDNGLEFVEDKTVIFKYKKVLISGSNYFIGEFLSSCSS